MIFTRGFAAIPVEGFVPDFPEGDCNYHSITAASDGWIYFSIGTHHAATGARLFRFHPQSESMEQVGDLNDLLNIDPSNEIPHGKIHTPLIEWNGYLYFATHTSQYDGSLPQLSPANGKAPYAGGHFMRLRLEDGQVEELAPLGLPNEGIITMAIDRSRGILFGLTWPSALLVSYDLESRHLINWGGVQQRGEWGKLPDEWNFVCRYLGVDEAGVVYGSTDEGRIWRFDASTPRPVTYYEQLSLDQVPPIQSESFTVEPEPHFFWRNWRTLRWNPATGSFWGLHGGSSQLFEFTPADGLLRSVRPMVPAPNPSGRRNPWRTQLGFTIGPNNTLFYLAHAPTRAPVSETERAPATAVHLLTYQIDSDEFHDHGPLEGSNGRRVFFTESLEIAADGHLYTVAWVTVTDPERMGEIQSARDLAAPDETSDVIYEMQLLRLPKWESLVAP